MRKLEDNEFNDAEFFANAHWLSCEKIYKRFSIPIISTQDLETKGMPAKYSLMRKFFIELNLRRHRKEKLILWSIRLGIYVEIEASHNINNN